MKRLALLLPALVAGIMSLSAARIDTVAIATKYLAVPDSVIIITPDGASDTRYPSVYMLNGFGGDHKGWLGTLRTDLPELADSYGMVVVMPHGQNSWYWDSPVDSTMQMESFFVNDLVPYIDANYPTVPCPRMRAISGLSMGGHGAFWLAMRHSDIWGNAGSMSGGVDIRPFPEKWMMKDRLGPRDENPERWDEYTVINLVPSLKPGQLNLTFDCGVDDFFYQVNCNLHDALLKAGIDHDFTSRPGAHSAPYWRNSALYHLLFFSENFKKAAAAR